MNTFLWANPSQIAEYRVNNVNNNNFVYDFQMWQTKRELTKAQKKIDSQLLSALERKRNRAKKRDLPSGELLVKFDAKGRAIVTIRARVTKEVLIKIKSLGGEVISYSERYNDIHANLFLEKLEKLAAMEDVVAIMPAEEASTNSL